MKNMFLIVMLSCAIPMVCFCRQELRSRTTVDSLAAQKTVNELKENITITSRQEQQVFAAVYKERKDRSRIFKKYWKSPGFKQELAAIEYIKDSTIRIVLGNEKYLKYRGIQHNTRLQFEAEQKKRYQYKLDSINRNPQKQSNGN